MDSFSLPLRFYSLARRYLVSHNFPALPAKLAVYSREENERSNETPFRDATEDPTTIFRWNEWKKSLPFFKHSDKTRTGGVEIFKKKKKERVVQRRKARVRNKNTFERKFKVDYLAVQDYTLRPAILVISRDKRRETY